MICPAFQSSFIYDDSEREKLFAYFEDSVPVINHYVNKSKYGIMETTSRSKRERQLRTIRMEIIFPEKADSSYLDSTLVASNNLSGLNARQIDSVNNRRSQPVNFYNVEQETYMKLFGEYLSFPEPEGEAGAKTPEGGDTESKEPDYSGMTRKERKQARREERKKRKEEQEVPDQQAGGTTGPGEAGS